jgi:aminopeptidase-like protein
MAQLMPLARSLTGPGTRATLAVLQRELPIEILRFPSRSRVLGWEVPDEWNLDRAWLEAPDGRVVADTDRHALHVVGYSEPGVHVLDLPALDSHLHSLPEIPNAIPYRTSYYARRWGFCLPDDIRTGLPAGRYRATVRGTLAAGHLELGELVVRGGSRNEVLVATHICHPQMANDNVTGIVAAVQLARWALSREPRLTYRFLFAPATVGALAWLAHARQDLHRIVHGLVITGVGDASALTWKRPRRGETLIDGAMQAVLADGDRVIDWYPYGYDERQFCSPGFDLPVGRLSRSLHGAYPEYHTSHDDLSFVDSGQVDAAVATVIAAFERLEAHEVLRNVHPHGEPKLGDHGLFRSTGGSLSSNASEHALLWVLSLADGTQDIDDIVQRSGLSRESVLEAASALEAAGLLER